MHKLHAKLDRILSQQDEILRLLRHQGSALGETLGSRPLSYSYGAQLERCHPDLHDWDMNRGECRNCGRSMRDRSPEQRY
jgi:hypothetical protein